MNKPSQRPSLFERLQAGLEEGVQFVRGQLNLRTTEMPNSPPSWRAKQVAQLRRKLGMSQGVFARMLNVSSKTVQSWEQGERIPSQAALRLLQILAANPDLVCEIVGIQTVSSQRRRTRASQ